MKTHTCPANGCTVVIGGDFVLCAWHWSKVPAPIRHNFYGLARILRQTKKPVLRSAIKRKLVVARNAAIERVNKGNA